MSKNTHWNRLLTVMKTLRDPGGCPWDREQSHRSLKEYLIEETYEVIEAIDNGQKDLLCEELGDLLLQVVFHAQIAADENSFTIEDVAKDIADKLIRRHPHVFGDKIIKNADGVVKNWDEIKKQEKKNKGIIESSSLDSIPHAMPGLFETMKLSKKAAKMGFDWKKPIDVIDKITEEIGEFKKAAKRNNKKEMTEELGDLLFSVANLGRAFKINPELALKSANKKFRNRFHNMETIIKDEKLSTPPSFTKWNSLWNKAKKKK